MVIPKALKSAMERELSSSSISSFESLRICANASSESSIGRPFWFGANCKVYMSAKTEDCKQHETLAVPVSEFRQICTVNFPATLTERNPTPCDASTRVEGNPACGVCEIDECGLLKSTHVRLRLLQLSVRGACARRWVGSWVRALCACAVRAYVRARRKPVCAAAACSTTRRSMSASMP
eukprot:183292-Pleurochrysis_carterae.AAC.5